MRWSQDLIQKHLPRQPTIYPDPVAVIALNIHDSRTDAVSEARVLADWLANAGHELREVPSLFSEEGERLLADSAEHDQLVNGLDLMVSLGGDGSMLRSVNLVADAGVPVLGVNFGNMAYLAEIEADGLQSAVARCLNGEHTIEERMRVAAQVERVDGSVEELGSALNEVVVENLESGRTVRLELTIDDDRFTTYNADGVIVASPTGSTAYSLSARGPIVAPTHEAIIVTSVSPHMLFDRSLVLSPHSRVQLLVRPDRQASVVLDGRQLAALEPGDQVVCTRSPHPGRFVAFGPRDFLGVLKDKFGLADPDADD